MFSQAEPQPATLGGGGGMEATIRFTSSNRSRNHLDGLSNGRLKWLYGGKKRLKGHRIMMGHLITI